MTSCLLPWTIQLFQNGEIILLLFVRVVPDRSRACKRPKSVANLQSA